MGGEWAHDSRRVGLTRTSVRYSARCSAAVHDNARTQTRNNHTFAPDGRWRPQATLCTKKRKRVPAWFEFITNNIMPSDATAREEQKKQQQHKRNQERTNTRLAPNAAVRVRCVDHNKQTRKKRNGLKETFCPSSKTVRSGRRDEKNGSKRLQNVRTSQKHTRRLFFHCSCSRAPRGSLLRTLKRSTFDVHRSV